ncbi:DsbA family protein [Erythrobacter sp. SDW2]|uniref:thioredoxin domain-containing protein n=1 Tax=Erythrobacter sp. SDW2 TaxID=2907154 RepID=UPI001F2C1B76|nr:thioredoxin domain-containing protein [Erythrobacter sp. SDW2]UIP07987.1 DsbA family protein [Erythrobacter sp. SDW2]
MTILRRLTFAALAAPLALGLAACGSDTTEGEVPEGAKVESVAPPAGTTWSNTAVVTPESGYMIGNPDAPIKLIEYGSLTCPACAAFAEEGFEALKTEYVDSGRVSFEFRSFLIHGPPDLVLTRLAECGLAEAVIPRADQVWLNIETIVPNFQAADPKTLDLPEDQRFVAYAEGAQIYDFFAKLGLNRDEARACLADTKAIERLANASQANAEKDGVDRTPTFLVNGRKVEASNWAQLEPILQRAGAR